MQPILNLGDGAQPRRIAAVVSRSGTHDNVQYFFFQLLYYFVTNRKASLDVDASPDNAELQIVDEQNCSPTNEDDGNSKRKKNSVHRYPRDEESSLFCRHREIVQGFEIFGVSCPKWN